MRRTRAIRPLLACVVVLVGCRSAAGDAIWPGDRDDHEAIAQAAADTFLSGVLDRVTDGRFASPPVSPLDLGVWQEEFDSVDEELFRRYGLGLTTSVGDQDANGLSDASVTELTIFWMQRGDVRRERCTASVDFEQNEARVVECTGV